MWQQIPYTTDGRHEQHAILKSLQNQSQGWCARAGGVLAVILRCAHQRHYRGPWTSHGPRGQGTQGIQMNLTLTHPPTHPRRSNRNNCNSRTRGKHTTFNSKTVTNLLLSAAPAVYSCFYRGHLRWRNGIPACAWGTCGAEMVFLLVSGALVVPRHAFPACIKWTCGGEIVFLFVSGAPAVAKWYSCLYQRHLRWRNGIPAYVWGTCGGKMVFLLVPRAPAVAR